MFELLSPLVRYGASRFPGMTALIGWLIERSHVGENIDDILGAHTELVSGEHEGAPEGLDAFDFT